MREGVREGVREAVTRTFCFLDYIYELTIICVFYVAYLYMYMIRLKHHTSYTCTYVHACRCTSVGTYRYMYSKPECILHVHGYSMYIHMYICKTLMP